MFALERRLWKKVTMSWPGRLILLILLLLLAVSFYPKWTKQREEDSKQKLSIQQRKLPAHRWKLKTDKPKLIIDIIPNIDKEVERDKWKEKIAKRMKKRQEHLRAACQSHGLNIRGADILHQPNPWEYFINKEHNFVWCNVFKSASTSWMYVMNVLAGYSQHFLAKTSRVPLTLARDRYPRPSVEQLEAVLNLTNVTSLLIGRNPLERLVSSYKDKIVGALPGTLHDKLRRKITLRYRPGSELPKDNRGVPVLPRVRRLPAKYLPTFVEFVRHVLEESEAGHEPDMHWAPVYSFCNPCQVNINTIAKVETLQEDTDFILDQIHLDKEKINMSKKNSSPDGKSVDSEVTNTYLKSIGPTMYEELLKLYLFDFNIFGYKQLNYSEL